MFTINLPKFGDEAVDSFFSGDGGTSFGGSSFGGGGGSGGKTTVIRTTYGGGGDPVVTRTTYGGDEPSYGGGTSRYGDSTPSYGGGSSRYGDSTPSYGGGSSRYGDNTPSYGGGSSRYGDNTPSYGGGSSRYGGGSSRYGGGGSKYGTGGLSGGDGGTAPATGFRRSRYGNKSVKGDTNRDIGIGGRSCNSSRSDPFGQVYNQKYSEIKQRCRQRGQLFEDDEFPAVDNNIYFTQRTRRFEWKRPGEICDDPQWISAGASRFDVRQGELGDCWLLAAVASLTCSEALFAKVVPMDQDFTTDYCGIFKFNFWHQGEWVEVVVDDRLPTYNGQLVFMHSTEKNEFWSALLEKAYAKLNGSYESLKGGSTSEAMEDFTGGVTEMFDLQKAPADLQKIMLKAVDMHSLMGCSIDADPNQLEAELENGLIMGHAYSVTAVKLVNISTSRVSGEICMVRIRNPWGNEAEWKGAWSDQSDEWTLISDEEKQEIGLTFDDDGEFWMSFKDFISNFEKLEICNLGPDSMQGQPGEGQKKCFSAISEHGGWTRRVNAGGCRNYLDTFWTNPQYRVTLTDADDDDEDNNCTMIVALLQKDRRKKRKEGLDLLTIGYVIYNLKEGESQGPLDVNFFKYNASCAKSPSFINLREMCGRHRLPPGTYAIIPSTFEPSEEGNFLLRIFTEKDFQGGEIDEQTSYNDEQRRRREAEPIPEPVQPLPVPSRGGRPDVEPPSDEEQQQEEALKNTFRRVAGDDMEIDAYELKDILNSVFTREFTFDGFATDICRSMVAMNDGDLSGKLGYEEFKDLWADLRRWKRVFKEFDHDASGTLNSYELRKALNSVGFKLSNSTFHSVVMRYSNSDGIVDFGDFVVCAIRLKTMLTSFKMADYENKGVASFDIDNFIQTTMYS
ncbi:hypothetical protein SNE40_009128 [Patella caerulea]|uniref:Calpain-A n=1 Tax=Patella caerulea TaxID=87958 RepID=A0AAN8PRH9_PATCE